MMKKYLYTELLKKIKKKAQSITAPRASGGNVLCLLPPDRLAAKRYNQLQLLPKITSGFWVLP